MSRAAPCSNNLPPLGFLSIRPRRPGPTVVSESKQNCKLPVRRLESDTLSGGKEGITDALKHAIREKGFNLRLSDQERCGDVKAAPIKLGYVHDFPRKKLFDTVKMICTSCKAWGHDVSFCPKQDNWIMPKEMELAPPQLQQAHAKFAEELKKEPPKMEWNGKNSEFGLKRLMTEMDKRAKGMKEGNPWKNRTEKRLALRARLGFW